MKAIYSNNAHCGTFCVQEMTGSSVPIFEWASWESTSAHLPASFHLNNEAILSMLNALNTWKRSASGMWQDPLKVESYLLFIALLHRDLELLDFDFDVDTPLASRPSYFAASLLHTKYFPLVTSVLAKIAKSIPVEGETINSTSAASHIAPSSESISSAPTHPRRPAPRQPKRRQVVRIESPESEGMNYIILYALKSDYLDFAQNVRIR